MLSPSFQLGSGFQIKAKGIYIVLQHILTYGVHSSLWSFFLTSRSQYYILPITMVCKPLKPSCEYILPTSFSPAMILDDILWQLQSYSMKL